MPMKIESYALLKHGIMKGKLPNGKPFYFMADNAETLVDEIYVQKVYETFREIQEDDIVVDVGAHVGLFSVMAAKKAKMVFSFEPEKKNFRLLVRNLIMHQLRNVIPINVALSDSEGNAELHIAKHSGGHSLLTMPWTTSKKQIVETRTLDNIAKEREIKHIDFMKIDVEGAEINVLSGAEESLKKTTYVSVAAYHDVFQPSAIEMFLKKRGFAAEIRMVGMYESKVVPYVYAKKLGEGG